MSFDLPPLPHQPDVPWQPDAELQPWQRGITELLKRIGPNDRVILRVGRRRSWLEVVHEESS